MWAFNRQRWRRLGIQDTIAQHNEARMKRLCQKVVSDLKIDLSGLKVVTEAANGIFVITPLIAALAGASKVICLARSSAYGSVEEMCHLITGYFQRWALPGPIITDDRTHLSLQGADIITNLGMVRPINRELLEWVGPDAVIPYMCESWELRPGDVDLITCKKMGIPVMGTNEDDKRINVFSDVGMLAVKMLLDAELEVSGNNIAVLGTDKFGSAITSLIRKCGANVSLFSARDQYQGVENLECDAIIVAEYIQCGQILGKLGIISGERLAMLLNSKPLILQFAGQNSITELLQYGCRVYPERQLTPTRMALTLADLGMRPAILLHAAGLLVGEKMARAKKEGLRGEDFLHFVQKDSPAQPIV